MFSRTNQRVSYKKKITDKDWQQQTLFYFSSHSQPLVRSSTDYYLLYRVAEGNLVEEDYLYITDPLGHSTKPYFSGYPAKMRNIDIIGPNYQLLMGEKALRPVIRTAVSLDSDLKALKTEATKKAYEDAYRKVMINTLAQQGASPEELQQNVPTKEEVEAKSISVSDEVAIAANMALEYLDGTLRIKSQFLDGYSDLVISGYTASYRDVHNNEVVREVVPPIEIKCIKDANTRFLEDAECVIRTGYMSTEKAIEQFKGLKGFDEIENSLRNNTNLFANNVIPGGNFPHSPVNTLPTYISVDTSDYNYHYQEGQTYYEHVTWTSWREVGALMVINDSGLPEIVTVDEDYEPLPDEEIEWVWVKEFMEGYILNGIHCLGVQAIPMTRASIENPSECKGVYNGYAFSTKHSEPISLIRKGIPFQTMFNVVSYVTEKIMAKNKDKITAIPASAIPDKEGWDIFTMMYYADATGYLIYENDPNNPNAVNGIKVLDAELGQQIVHLYEIRALIKQQWDETCGITPQRKGDIAVSAGKATTEEAIYRSAMISEYMHTTYDEFQTTEYQTLIDFSQSAWIDGKKATFMNSELRLASLEINPEKYSTHRLRVFTTSSKQYAQHLEMLKNNAFAFAQKGAYPASSITEIIKANNIEQLSAYLKEKEAEIDAKQRAQYEQDNKVKVAAMEKDTADKMAERELKRYEIDMGYEKTVDAATISANAKMKMVTEDISPEMTLEQRSRFELEARQFQENIRQFNEEQRRKKEEFEKKLNLDAKALTAKFAKNNQK